MAFSLRQMGVTGWAEDDAITPSPAPGNGKIARGVEVV